MQDVQVDWSVGFGFPLYSIALPFGCIERLVVLRTLSADIQGKPRSYYARTRAIDGGSLCRRLDDGRGGVRVQFAGRGYGCDCCRALA